ncbi:MAG: Na/Pi cotransporter family protein, partial [Lachnospiraceae bacterium]|nr:Na/Pi cotransporter family protein [Lachnospiraceae bacterium]
SSSATTVMVVSFVNAGLLTLVQAIGVIMGANIGTTVTSWLLSLTQIDGSSLFLKLLKPTSFTPILALIGIIMYMFLKNDKKKDTGMILLGFAVLMTGMDTMSGAVAGLKNVPEFTNLLTVFSNPILGVLAGAILTAIIQSSSASVGILQALSSTGTVTFSSAIPIIMGQNIGTCVTAMISSVGANKNARRTSLVHLYFNLVGTIALLIVFYTLNSFIDFAFVNTAIDAKGIATVHTIFNLLCTLILLPFGRLLEKMAYITIPDKEEKEEYQMLDERLLGTPAVAVERCKDTVTSMAQISVATIKQALNNFDSYTAKIGEEVRAGEAKVDQYEDHLGTYLVKLSALDMTHADSNETTKLLHILGDFERISDHAVNVIESAEEMKDKHSEFSGIAKQEINAMIGAVNEILDLALDAFCNENLNSAFLVEPLEQVVDYLKDTIKKNHIARLRKNECTIELGFILSDLITNLERVADHCSNIAGCMLEMTHEDLDIHEYLRNVKNGEIREFNEAYEHYMTKYNIA